MMSTQTKNDQAIASVMAAGAIPGKKVARAKVVAAGERAILIRPLTSGDGEKLLGMYSRLSLESIYRRFHTPFPRVPVWLVLSFANADQCHMVGVVAAADGEIVGHAMYVRSEDGNEAEFAIVVEDGWQSRGVGKLLLSKLAGEARHQSVEFFTGSVLAENGRVFGLIDAVFARARRSFRDGSYSVCVPLRALKPLTIREPLTPIQT